MQRNTDPWVLVLAAGSGTRLSELTKDQDGITVPKQFCSLRGGRSLLLDTIDRAMRMTTRQRVVVVVAEQHARWWKPQLACLAPQNIIVQPENRGTTAGLLLPLAHILECDPAAHVAVLPCDHFVAQPAVLNQSMRSALDAVRMDDSCLVLLGMAPDSPDTEYGWILPCIGNGNGPRGVAAFVEKPPLARAMALHRAGALWNSFLFAGAGRVLWHLCASFTQATAFAIANAWKRPVAERGIALDAVYRGLSAMDFSRTVLGGSASQLRLVQVPECGWTDLGTPSRVAECLAGIEQRTPNLPIRAQWYPSVDLVRALGHRRQESFRLQLTSQSA